MNIARVTAALRSPRVQHAAAYAVATLTALGVITQVLGAGLNHNEHMYLAASALFGDGRLYTDFAFFQTPLLVWIDGTLIALTGTTRLLLVGRLVTLAFTGLLAFSFYRSARLILGDDRRRAAWATAALLTGVLTLHAMRESSNYMLPMALSTTATWLCLEALARRRRAVPALFACGLLLGLSISAKLYYATLPAAFLIVIWSAPRTVQRLDRVLAWGAGLVLGVAPIIYYLIRDAEAFVFNNLEYHQLNVAWCRLVDYTYTLTLATKLHFAARVLSHPAAAVVPIALVVLGAVAFRERRRLAVPRDDLRLLILLWGVAAVTAFVPRPMYVQYLSMQAPFGLLLALALVKHLAPFRPRLGRWTFIGVVFVSLWWGLRPLLRHRYLVFRPYLATVLRGHRSGGALRAVVERVPRSYGTKIATISPIVPLEAGLPIYRELATGPFFFRVGDLLSNERLKRHVGASETGLARLLDADPPRAIFLGLGGKLDAAFELYAREHDYLPLDAFFSGGVLYVPSPVAAELASEASTESPPAPRREGSTPGPRRP